MLAPDGKHRKVQSADLEGIFSIIQSIPSKKAEPIKQWLSEVGAQRIDQMIDPELTFQMAVEDYRRQGCPFFLKIHESQHDLDEENRKPKL